MRKTFRFLGSVALLAMLSLMGVGCESEPRRVTADSIRDDLTPELYSIALTEEEYKNMIARTINTNMRQIPDDWAFFWLLERPMRTSRYPIP